MIRIEKTNLLEALKKYPLCKHLTLSKDESESMMTQVICDHKFKKERVVTFLYFKNDILIGWSWAFRCSKLESNSINIMIFVNPSYREMGIGKALLNEAINLSREKRKTYFVFPWDNQSEVFYKNCNVTSNHYSF